MKNPKIIARLTGVGYLIIFICGFYGNFYVLENLLISGDAYATFQNIMNNSDAYKMGVFTFLLMVIVDLILAWPLYTLLKGTNKKMALISSLLRVINAGFFFVALGNLFDICQQIQGESLTPSQTLASFEQFKFIWTIGLLVFGAHLLLLGNLIYRSTLFPKILGILIALAGLGYLVDCTAQLGLSSYTEYKYLFEMMVVILGVVGEFSLTIWLLVKGVRK